YPGGYLVCGVLLGRFVRYLGRHDDFPFTALDGLAARVALEAALRARDSLAVTLACDSRADARAMAWRLGTSRADSCWRWIIVPSLGLDRSSPPVGQDHSARVERITSPRTRHGGQVEAVRSGPSLATAWAKAQPRPSRVRTGVVARAAC